VGFTMLHLRYW